MKLQSPVDVDLFQFIVNGRFDYIEVGQTKEWVLNNFPDPDCGGQVSRNSKFCIWLYGNIEFHFEGEMLYGIWCDNFYRLNAGRHIRLDRWILGRKKHRSLANLMKAFHRQKVSFTLVHNPKFKNVVIRILKSQVDLYFECEDEENYTSSDASAFYLTGFGLSHSDYRANLQAWE